MNHSRPESAEKMMDHGFLNPKRTSPTFAESINFEWVHAYHKESDGRVVAGPWLDRIIDHARSNGFKGKITPRGALRIINSRLYD